MIRRILFLSLLVVSVSSNSSFAGTDRYILIICGNGGETEYQTHFLDWGMRLQKVGLGWLGVTEEKIVLFTEAPDSPTPTRLETIDSAFERMKNQTSSDSEIFVFLIGHGSYLKSQSKFQIPGEDLTPEHLNNLLKEIPARLQIVVNASSCSAGFINVLTDPKRIVCTATKSAEENNAPEFMEYFLQGLEQNLADLNHDQRITLLEACRYASYGALNDYRQESLIATEHALLDDNGDGLGERLSDGNLYDESQEGNELAASNTDGQNTDGQVASHVLLIDESFPRSAPQDRIDAYLTLLEEVENVKKDKGIMKEEEYYQKLEELLIQAARLHREILTSDPKPPPNSDTH